MPVYAYDVNPDVSVAPPVNYAASPGFILGYDFYLILHFLYLVPSSFFPPHVPGLPVAPYGALIQIVSLLISLGLWVMWMATLWFGIPMPWISAAIGAAVIKTLSWMQGDRVIPATLNADSARFAGEAWFAVNGICTSRSGLQISIDHLQHLFHRPITGLVNRTHGIFFDLLECLIQRDFFWTTGDLRVGYDQLCRAILDDSKPRVVLFAHSQGAILASRWMDQLLADFPPNRLEKLEVYTFASAANHFSAPLAGVQNAPFSYVEHFANDDDFVARIGVLEFSNQLGALVQLNATPGVIPTVDARYAGRVFVRPGGTGHLWLSSYLTPGNSILSDPLVIANSRLVEYLGGALAIPGP